MEIIYDQKAVEHLKYWKKSGNEASQKFLLRVSENLNHSNMSYPVPGLTE
ncbi:hypothetical protein [Pedobacter rhodius]|nr:hypothetical protein [Pedobacter sp. SJ11]